MRGKIVLISLPFMVAFMTYVISLIQSTTGPHGGKYKIAHDYKIEVKTEYPFVYAYLLDAKSKPIKNKGLSCEITFLIPGGEEIGIQLKPFRSDGFLMESNSINYNSFRVKFNVFGEIVSATFPNESFIVHKNTKNESIQ